MRSGDAGNATAVVAFHPTRRRIAVVVEGGRGIESHIEDAVERAVQRVLRPYLRRICEPEPATYTAAQAARVLQVSEDTIGRMVRRGALTRVPYVDGKLLIPRAAVDRLVADDSTLTPLRRTAG